MVAVFKPNPAFGKQLLATASLAVFMDAVARRGKAQAETDAPIGETGNLRNSIEVVRTSPTARRVTAGGSKAPYWIFVEFGTRYMPAQPFLRPLIEKLGLHR